MNHSFDIELAKKYGILEAILLQHIYFWVRQNMENEKNLFNGKYWTYNSVRAFNALFPYATPKQIRTALNKLRKEELVETGNFGEDHFNRCLWYTVTDKGVSELTYAPQGNSICPTGQTVEEMACPDGQLDLPHRANDINNNNIYSLVPTDINITDINNISDINTPYHPPQENQFSEIVSLYNEICVDLPKVRDLTEARKKALKTLLKQYTIGDIEQVFTEAQASDFCSGRSGRWSGCGFDWLIKPSNFTKVREGNYKNKEKKQESIAERVMRL